MEQTVGPTLPKMPRTNAKVLVNLRIELLRTHLQRVAHHLRECHNGKIIPFSHNLEVMKGTTIKDDDLYKTCAGA